jgi:hypothetical protein
MAKQTVMLRVPVAESWDAGDAIQVYADNGTGTVDFNTPLLARPAPLFPGQHAAKGVGLQPVGRGRTGDQKARRARPGMGRAVTGKTKVGTSPKTLAVPVEVSAAFGNWKFSAKLVDRFGVVQAAAGTEAQVIVSGTEPPPLSSFTLNGYDFAGDVATFDFVKGSD